MNHIRKDILGLILAGGQSRRMDGIDKGLVCFKKKPMVSWIVDTLQGQVNSIAINANRNQEKYRIYTDQIFSDQLGGFKGPLAGLHAAMTHSNESLIATVPCDSPFIPDNLICRLREPLNDSSIDLTVVQTGSRIQPVFSMARKSLKSSLEKFLVDGGRKIDIWYQNINIHKVTFPNNTKHFVNFNSLKELRSAEVTVNHPNP